MANKTLFQTLATLLAGPKADAKPDDKVVDATYEEVDDKDKKKSA